MASLFSEAHSKLQLIVVYNAHLKSPLSERQPAWPRHEALMRFDLPLQRMTTFFAVTKKWFPRFFCMRGRRLYYSDGNNGHPDSQDGTLAFMRSNPAPDGRYCVDLQGMLTRVNMPSYRVTLLRRLLCSRVQHSSGRAGVCVRDHVRCRQPGARKRSSTLRHSLAQSHVMFTGGEGRGAGCCG